MQVSLGGCVGYKTSEHLLSRDENSGQMNRLRLVACERRVCARHVVHIGVEKQYVVEVWAAV